MGLSTDIILDIMGRIKKKNLSKMRRGGEKVIELRDKYAAIYDEVMQKVYDKLKSE